MSNNDINKNLQDFTEYKYPINHSLNNSLIGDIVSNTPHKDYFFQLRSQMNMNNISNLLLSDLKSPNKLSSLYLKKKEDIFDHSLFINGYNSSNKNNNNSEFEQEKITNSKLYFNTKKKGQNKLLCRKRFFKYILSSEEKITKKGNVNINISQVSLHGYHLSNLKMIENACELKNIILPKALIKLLKKKYNYFKIIHIDNNLTKTYDYNLNLINLTFMEMQENNLDYYKGEMNTVKIIKNYCDDMHKEIEKAKNNYTKKKNIIYMTKSILLIELLIRNCNLFTNYIMKKVNQLNSQIKSDNNIINNNFHKINNSNSLTPKFILIPQKNSIQNINKQYMPTLPQNNNTTAKKALFWNSNIKTNNCNSSENTINNIFISKQKTLFRAKIPLMNTYKCDFCERVFKNGQALGGHISQSHPKQSNKYKQKIEIRNSRTDRRELLYEARRRLFNSYHIDLDYLLKNKRKNEIKMFIKVHKCEYKKELSNLKDNQRNESNNMQNNNEDCNSNVKNDLTSSYINNTEKKNIFIPYKEK